MIKIVMRRFLSRGGAAAILSVLSISPPALSVMPLPGNYLFLVASTAVAASFPGWTAKVWPLAIYWAVLFTASTAGVLTSSFDYTMHTVYLGAGLVLLSRFQKEDFVKFSDSLDAFITVGLVLAVVSSAAFIARPVEAFLFIENPDGRENGLYYLTFTNAAFDGFIRPAFIFDEPGAFSFLIVVAALTRELLGKSRLGTSLLLIGGLVTLSLTHVLITALYLLRHSTKASMILTLAATVPSAWMVLVFFGINLSEPAGMVASRLELADGRLAGDNRSVQVDNFLELADQNVFLFGIPRCLDPEDLCRDLGDMSSNPFTVIVNYGMLVAWPYYALLAGLLVSAVDRRLFFPAVSMFLLLLQRPSLFGFGYGAIIVIPCAMILRNYSMSLRREAGDFTVVLSTDPKLQRPFGRVRGPLFRVGPPGRPAR